MAAQGKAEPSRECPWLLSAHKYCNKHENYNFHRLDASALLCCNVAVAACHLPLGIEAFCNLHLIRGFCAAKIATRQRKSRLACLPLGCPCTSLFLRAFVPLSVHLPLCLVHSLLKVFCICIGKARDMPQDLPHSLVPRVV